MTEHRKTRGMSLIETAIVLGVVGLVIGGIWVAASAVSAQMAVNKFSERLARIATDIQANYRQVPSDYMGGTTANYLIAKGHYQASEAHTYSTFKSPELGPESFIEYTYYGYNFGTDPSQRGLEVRIWNVLKARCRPVISRMLPLFADYRILSFVFTPLQQMDDAISTCESSNFINVRFNGVKP